MPMALSLFFPAKNNDLNFHVNHTKCQTPVVLFSEDEQDTVLNGNLISEQRLS